MVGRFGEVCRKRGLKINAFKKSRVMVLNRKVHVDGIRLVHVLEFKYLGCVLDESDTDGVECSKKVASGRKVAGAFRPIVNVRDLQIECSRVLHERLLVPILMYDSEIMLWKEKERSRIKAVQMDNLRGLLGIGKIDRIPNSWIKELYGVKKGLNEEIDEDVLRKFGPIERTERDRVANRVYVGECGGSRSVSRPRKRWTDTVKQCLRKRGLDVRQARRMVQDRSEWWGFVRGVAREMNL